MRALPYVPDYVTEVTRNAATHAYSHIMWTHVNCNISQKPVK